MPYRIENRYQDEGWKETGEEFDLYEAAFDHGFELARDAIVNGMVRIVEMTTGQVCHTWGAGETAGKHNGLAKLGESFACDRHAPQTVKVTTPIGRVTVEDIERAKRSGAAFVVFSHAHDHGTREEPVNVGRIDGPDPWVMSPPARHANANDIVKRLEASLPSHMQSYIIGRDLVVDTIEELQRLRHYAKQLEYIACSLPSHDGVTGQRARIDTARKATRVNYQAIHGVNQ